MLFRLFFTSNFKNDDKYLALPKFFSPFRMCWAGYGHGWIILKFLKLKAKAWRSAALLARLNLVI